MATGLMESFRSIATTFSPQGVSFDAPCWPFALPPQLNRTLSSDLVWMVLQQLPAIPRQDVRERFFAAADPEAAEAAAAWAASELAGAVREGGEGEIEEDDVSCPPFPPGAHTPCPAPGTLVPQRPNHI